MYVNYCKMATHSFRNMAESQFAGFITYLSPKRPWANKRPQFDVRIQTSADKEIVVKGFGDGAYKKLQDFDRREDYVRKTLHHNRI